MSECAEHKWEFLGTVYWYSGDYNPGGSARTRMLGDKFFCSKCLDIRIVDERVNGDSYCKPIPGTIPR